MSRRGGRAGARARGAAGAGRAAAARRPAAQQPVEHAREAHGSEHAVRDTIAKLLNFAVLVGVLVYFLKTPLAGYLSRAARRFGRISSPRRRCGAPRPQLEAIQQQIAALPAELAALKARGEEDVRAEQVRIAEAAQGERERLLDQTRREIEMRLRLARRELTEYAAELAVSVAQERIKRTITPEDQLRLVDRYTTQLKEAR